MARLIVLETNEIPLEVHRWYAEQAPESAIAHVLKQGHVGETVNRDDTGSRELYPSQTWATMATGLAYSEHGIYWYADEKRPEHPLYWELAAAERTVGLVGALHSSPYDRLESLPGLRFCMPDVFATDTAAHPDSLRPLQAFSIAMANRNARAVRGVSSPRLALEGANALVQARLSRRGMRRVGGLVWNHIVRKTPAERLRTAHFEISADVFLRQTARHDPDLAVFFTNHVAAAMHRYWYATFPDHWEGELFDDAWCDRYGGEIRHAMDSLDAFVDRVLGYCEKTGRRLLMLSSMGQTAAQVNAEQRTQAFVADDPTTFLTLIGLRGRWTPRLGMAPQVSAAFDTAEDCASAARELDTTWGSASGLTFETAGTVLTVTYRPVIESTGKIVFGDRVFTAEELGGALLNVDDSRNGEHHPRGAFLMMGSTAAIPDVVDARDIAPAILTALDIDPAPHHRDPGFTIT